MSVNIIDTIKPKNNGSFPIVEAVDVEVSEGLRLPEALAAKANTSTTDNLQAQVDQIAQSAGAGTADTEIAQARVDAYGTSYQTLKERLDTDDSKHTREETYIQQSVDSIGKYNDNLFDKEKATNGKFYKATAVGDVITTNDNGNYYCFVIPVKPDTDYTIKQISYYVYITDDNNVVLRIKSDGNSHSNYTINTGNNAVKMFVSVSRNGCLPEDMMVVEGTEIPQQYIPYGFIFSDDAEKSIKNIADVEGINQDITDIEAEIADYKSDVGEKLPNLFDKAEIIPKFFYKANGTGEEVYQSANNGFYCISLPCKPNTDYAFTQVSYTTYFTDENDIVLKAAGIGSHSDYTTNSGVGAVKMFVSIAYSECEPDDMMIVEGSELPEEYSSYGFDFSVEATKSIEEIANVEEVSTSIENLSTEITDYKKEVGEQSANLFDKTTITTGSYYFAAAAGDEVELKSNSAFYCFIIPVKPNTDYTIKQISYSLFITNENGIVLAVKNGSAQQLSDYTINTGDGARFIYVSTIDYQCSPDAMMVVAGTTLPETYAPYGFVFSDDAEYSIKEISKESTNGKVYTVGVGKDYETFTACIRDLKDDATPKTIYIDSGIYDMYEEMGGAEFIDSIPDDETQWRNVCDIVPPNTTVIGIGYVEFRYDPEYYTATSTNLISPLNIAGGNITIENIRVIGKNCRYAIHDDGSGDNDSVTHIYKNVVCNKIGGGYSQSFGSGIGKRCSIEFYGCEILSNRIAFSVHNQWYATLGRIVFENCVIIGNAGDVRLSSLSSRDTTQPIGVTIRNSKVSTISYTNEDGETSRTIPYMVTVCNSGTPTFDDSAFSENQFPPTVY
jgi:hypothetical protein